MSHGTMLQDVIGRADAECGATLRPSSIGLTQIRLNPVIRRVIAMHVAVLALSAPLYPLLGLSIAWRTLLPQLLLLGMLLGASLTYAAVGGPHKLIIAETLLATCLLVLFTNIVGAAQYTGVALGLPLVDSWLASADAAMGIHVPALTEWTGAWPLLTLALTLAYFSLLPQFVLALIGLGLRYRDRERLWEYVFHFHFCLTVTLLGVTLLPAACAFSYYGFSSLIDQTRFISHFEGLRAGTLTEIRFDDIEGLISFPSFHVAGGLMVTWAFRHSRWWAAPLVVLNGLLIAATVLTGAHYAIDVVMTVVLFAVSVWLWRVWGRSGL